METIRSKHNLPPLRLAPLVPPPAQDVPHQVDPPLNHYFKEQSNLQQRFLQNEPPASPFVFFNNEVPPSPFHPNRSVYTQPTPQSNPYSQQLQQQPYPSPQTPNFPQYQSTSYQQLDSSHSPVIINSQFNQSNIIYNHNHNHYPQIQNSNLNASTSQFQLRRGAGAQTNNQVYNPELLGPIPTSSARVWNWDANQRNLIEPSNHRVNDGNSSSYWNRVENSNIQPYFNQPSEAFDSNTSQLEFHSKPVPSVSASASTSTSTSTPTISANQTRRPFIEKLSHILEAVATTVDESGAEIIYTNCYSDTISFDQTGEYILVLSEKGGRLENEILPHWFSHKSTAAFSRQMNLYQFTHLTRAETKRLLSTSPAHQNRFINPKEWRAWKHPKFLQSSPLLRLGMKPTPSKARREAKAELDQAINYDKSKFGRKLNWNALEKGMRLDVDYKIIEPAVMEAATVQEDEDDEDAVGEEEEL